MLTKKNKTALLLALYTGISIAADVGEVPSKSSAKPVDSKATIELEEVEVKAKRRRIITPLPGVPMDKAIASTNIQSATGKELIESKALNVTDYMNNNMQSVTTTDYAGNPFQQDLNFRGFTASPAIGTPQGISVYMDGVRINESFGEVVSWDMIPMNAISSINLIPGSNPLFGLNTIGGALAIRTKDAFSDNFLRTQYSTGAWGRDQFQFSNGINNGQIGFFTAYSHFKEDGWRDSSPSNVRQMFNKLTIRLDKAEFNLSALNVDASLVGNGMLPFEMADQDRKQVFTSPDEVKNNLEHYNMSGSWYVNDKLTLSGMMFKRKMSQYGIGADVYDAYSQLVSAWGDDIDGDGVVDAGKINGLFNYSDLNQASEGFNLQAAFDLDKHQIVLGASLDKNKVGFLQSQQLGEINDADHSISIVTDPIFETFGYTPAYMTIARNNLKGTSKTESIYAFDTWSPTDNLHISLGARMNWSNVKNTLVSDSGKEFYNFTSNDFNPLRQKCFVPGDVSPTRGRFICSEGDYDYRSFNPSVGVTWEVKENFSTYANISRGARTPTVIELGCANDPTKSNAPGSTNYQFGCSIPTSLSSDPYLKQIRSTAYETGLRGESGGWDWNVGYFRTEITDDILFVPLGRKNRGVFNNFGRTLREGVEFGLKGNFDRDKLSLNYTLMAATFESSARIINDSNSTNGQTDSANAAQAFVDIHSGDEIPGMPNNIIQASWNHRFTNAFDATLSMVMHSSAFVRGNENNDHQPRAALPGERYDYIGEGSTAGYAVFNLRANYKFSPGVNAFIKFDNIFDREYATAGALGRNPFGTNGNFQTNPTAWNNTTFIGPGAPRALWIGVSLDWDWKNKAFKD